MGKITVVGIGPGNLADMTPRARKAVEEASVIAGYTTYIRLIEPLIADKPIIGTGMMQEIDRCRQAIDAASNGANVAVISSGDAGIYGMAGLVLEMLLRLPEEKRPVYGGVIAGVSAVQASAAILGAPLMHDFAVISLSNLLTPQETIERRVRLAAEGVRQIVLKYRKPETPVGIVTAASRDGEKKEIATLSDFTEREINMFSLVVIGNSHTYVKEGWMITPRGYENKEEFR